MSHRTAIEQVDPGVMPELEQLVDTAIAEGHTFVRKTEDEWLSGDNRFDQPGEGFFVARANGAIVGICGLNIDPFARDPSVGRLRHLYVHPDRRGEGVGRRLVDACLALAHGSFDRVRVRTFDPEAAAFYLSVGLVRLSEADATHGIALSD